MVKLLKNIVFLGLICSPATVFAAVPDIANAPSPVAVMVPISGTSVSYGDLIDYDTVKGTYFLSQYPDDGRIVGVTVKNPPLVLVGSKGEVPILRSGTVLVNITLENGPIQPGDAIIASSISGKGMKASSGSKNIIGTARESFTGSQISLSLKGKNIPAGTIVVQLSEGLGGGSGTGITGGYAGGCTTGEIPCLIAQKIDATPLVTLMRYIFASVVALGSLYLAFRSFMADAVNGVISVGRNPRAKVAIQAMVIFNGLLAGFIALAGLGVGLLILFVQL